MERPQEFKQYDKQIGRYLTFKLIDMKPKTSVWHVTNSNSGAILGNIEWYGPWRQYVFCDIDGVFNNGCLEDISLFLTALNQKKVIVPKVELIAQNNYIEK